MFPDIKVTDARFPGKTPSRGRTEIDHKTVKKNRTSPVNTSHILIQILWHLSVLSLTKFNTKWRSKRMLENPVSANRKRDRKPGSNNVGHFS